MKGFSFKEYIKQKMTESHFFSLPNQLKPLHLYLKYISQTQYILNICYLQQFFCYYSKCISIIIRKMEQTEKQQVSIQQISINDTPISLSERSNQKEDSDERNGKWSNIEHAKYIAYMQLHRDKFRSKQRRRAHKFYKQMAAFIKTRNALQCRSHHQKLQDRYSYANKIIMAFKQHGDLELYQTVLSQLKNYQSNKNGTSSCSNKTNEIIEISTQTDLAGVNVQYVIYNQQMSANGSIQSFPTSMHPHMLSSPWAVPLNLYGKSPFYPPLNYFSFFNQSF